MELNSYRTIRSNLTQHLNGTLNYINVLGVQCLRWTTKFVCLYQTAARIKLNHTPHTLPQPAYSVRGYILAVLFFFFIHIRCFFQFRRKKMKSFGHFDDLQMVSQICIYFTTLHSYRSSAEKGNNSKEKDWRNIVLIRR